MPGNYNKSENQYAHIMGIWTYAVIFFVCISVVQLIGHYRSHLNNTKNHCTYLAELIKNDVSYGNQKAIQNFFDDNTSATTRLALNDIGLDYWHVTAGSDILAEKSEYKHTFLNNLVEVTSTCNVQDIRNSSDSNNKYSLTVIAPFKLKQAQFMWVFITSLFLAGLPLLIYSRISQERIHERNGLLNFFLKIAQREHRKLPDETLNAGSIDKILSNESDSIIKFIDDTRELNDRIDPEYINRLEKNFIDLEERSAHLSIQNKELSRQTTLKSSFFANLSHDFRTPLYTIDGYSRFLLETDLDRKQLSHVSAVQTANANLLELVSNFLSLSRLEAGKIDLEYSPLDLRQLIQEIVTGLSFLTTEHKNHFFIDVSEKLPRLIETDAIKLRQILANLISNAVKYTEKGFIYIRINCRHLGTESLSVTLSVSDTGKGISEQDIRTIFDPYTRLTQDKTKIHGTGLGLGICKELCEVIGAKLVVDSEVAKGSNFTIDFNSKAMSNENEKSVDYDFKPLGNTLYVFNSIAAFDIYLPEWLRQLDVSLVTLPWKNLTYVNTQSMIKPNDKVLIILDYEKQQDISQWAPSLEWLGKNLIVCCPIDYLSSDELDMLDAFIVVPNNLSNYDLSSTISSKESSQKIIIEKLSDEPLKDYVLLLAEDNDLNRRIIEERLHTFGAQVISCPDGSAALELYKARPYSAILMDAHMPKISGTELTEMIRREFSDHNTPIIGITASTSTVEYQYFIQSGMTDCLIKPLQDKQLIDTILKFAQPVREALLDEDNISESLNVSQEQSTQIRIDNLSIDSIKSHIQRLDLILQNPEIENKQNDLFQEIHKLNGTLSMTSFNSLQENVNEIEVLINPMLWPTDENNDTTLSKKLLEAEQLYLAIRSQLVEKIETSVS